MPDIQNAHFIRLRYHGPTNTRGARISATWEGWPSDDHKPVRRWLPYEPPYDMAETAAAAFCDWLSSGRTGLAFSPRLVTLAAMPGAEWALCVQTEARATAG